MIQPATLIERETAGGQKIGTYSNCDVVKLLCSCWSCEVHDGVL